MRFGRRKIGNETVAMEVPSIEVPYVYGREPKHTPELEMERVANLLEVAETMKGRQDEYAPLIAGLALGQADEICETYSLDPTQVEVAKQYLVSASLPS